eukprot:TRINITY_DN1477_c1_g3_i2.p1 TRINITY_DN1477_c1_g3~~TRINITY_DN1477_c1_g3_i2.p1  ORF type:complete len:155 (-),score=14.34 TRINITY_DN1477_c1_g3_i2:132-596(-)
MVEGAGQRESPVQERNDAGRTPGTARHMKNPMPESGSRRDSCGAWSIGSQGHENGLCKGPCHELRSGRGCTWGKKCKLCHHPHPEISSSSIRSKKSKRTTLTERMDAMGLDDEQKMNFFFPEEQDGFDAGHQGSSSVFRRLAAMPQTQCISISL